MYRWWLIVSRATIVFLTIFPMWLGYAILFVEWTSILSGL